MPTSKRWSKRSDDCRIDIRPSRLCAGCVAAAGCLGFVGWWSSDAPSAVAIAGSIAWLVGAGLIARGELRRPVHSLVLRSDGMADLDGRPLERVRVDWRGPFFSLAWQEEGVPARWLGFPDVLDAAARRGLRLWHPAARERDTTAAVAP